MQTSCDSSKQYGRPLRTAAQQHTDYLDTLGKEGANVENKSGAFCAALLDVSVNFKCAECVEILWDKGIDVHFRYFNGKTPLICAALSGQCSLMQKLIAAGAGVNDVCNDGRGALHCSRSKECTELLVREGADVNLKDHNGVTPLHPAIARSGSIDCTLPLVSAGADVNAKCHKGETPLIKAARLGKLQEIELLLEKGANVNAFDFFGRNALYYAVWRGNDTVLQLLLRGGADVNVVNPYNKESSSKVTTSAGFEECNKILFQTGVDVNTTALMRAVENGYEKCVKLLLEAGANVKDTPQALIVATCRGYHGCVKLLVEAGADVNVCSDSGTALHNAARREYLSCIHWLLWAGADVNALDTNSQSPLMLAAGDKSLLSVKLLLQAGAEVRLTDKVGCNALHCSVIKHVHGGKSKVVTEIVRLLHAAGERGKVRTSERSLPKPLGRPGPRRLIGLDRKHLLMSVLSEPKIDPEQLSGIVRQYLQDDELTLCLMHICRQTIREHLLQMSRVNLFVRVPHLGLPSLLTEFLLYDVSLESLET